MRDENCYGIDTIPQGIEQILFRISEYIPVGIISSKDYTFLHRRARFAKILSCVLGKALGLPLCGWESSQSFT
jgi:hypothetical protein